MIPSAIALAISLSDSCLISISGCCVDQAVSCLDRIVYDSLALYGIRDLEYAESSNGIFAPVFNVMNSIMISSLI